MGFALRCGPVGLVDASLNSGLFCCLLHSWNLRLCSLAKQKSRPHLHPYYLGFTYLQCLLVYLWISKTERLHNRPKYTWSGHQSGSLISLKPPTTWKERSLTILPSMMTKDKDKDYG